MFNKFKALLKLRKVMILTFIISIIVIASVAYFIIRSNSEKIEDALVEMPAENVVSAPVSYMEESAVIVEEEKHEDSKTEFVQNNEQSSPGRLVLTEQRNWGNESNQTPSNSYTDNPMCTDEATVFEATILTGGYLEIQQGEKGNIYADTMHNCTNPDNIFKIWINMTTEEIMSYTNQIDLSALEAGSYELGYATWNDEFYSEAYILVVVHGNIPEVPEQPEEPISYPE